MGVGSFSLPIIANQFTYTYPSDWVSITGVPDNEIFLCVSDEGTSTVAFTVTTSASTYNVDWGDGTSSTGITSNTIAQKQYTIGAGLTGTTNPGVTTFKARIYATAGTITRFFISRATNTGSNQTNPIYAANFGTTGLTSMANAFFLSDAATSPALQSVQLPTALNSCTTFFSAFEKCRSLRNIQFPLSVTGVTTMNRCFNTCISLEYIRLSETTFSNSFTMANMCQSSTGMKRVDFPNVMNGTTAINLCFNGCPGLETVNLPSSMTGCTNFDNFFGSATNLQNVTFPTTLHPSNTINFAQMFDGCTTLQNFTFPAGALRASALNATFNACPALKWVKFPTTLNNVGSTSTCFSDCTNLSYVEMPTSMTSLTNSVGMFRRCPTIDNITLPIMSGVTNASEMFDSCFGLRNVTGLSTIGRTSTSAVNMGGNFLNNNELYTGGTIGAYLSVVVAKGTSATIRNGITTFRLSNATSPFTGSSPQVDVSWTSLSTAALVDLFNDLPTLVSKTINITSATGAAGLTAGDRAIATGKGWTITG
jgi:hypothetical protein